MAGTHNLSQSEATDRARLLTVHSYAIALDVTDGNGNPGEQTFRSRTVVRFGCAEPGAVTFIEAAAARLRSAVLNGERLDLSGWSPAAGLELPGLAADNELVVDGDFEYCPTEQGLHRAVDPADGEVYLYTQFEPADAQRVFACFDQPDLKARFTWQVTMPGHWRAISTAAVAGQSAPAADGTGSAPPAGAGAGSAPPAEAGSGPAARTVHFAESIPMSTYVTALCAGPYHEVRREHDGIDLGLYCRRSLRPYLLPDFLFEITAQGFDHYHANFGVRYPLSQYNQIFVPEYVGAMEHFGCVTYDDGRSMHRTPPTDAQLQRLAMVMLHEMAHMWFGDLVTMKWWNDLWLNESFATWASAWANAEATRFAGTSWPSFLEQWKSDGYESDQLASTHPVYAVVPDVDAVGVNFDRITYGKGAAVLKQLVAYTGIDAFLAGLREYFGRHAWGNTTVDDLLGALAQASGREVRTFADQWLRTTQVNTLRLEVAEAGDGTYRGVAVRQQAPREHPTLRTHRIALGLFDLHGSGRLARRDRLDLEVSGELTEVPGLTGAPVADLLLLNDDDLSYAKVRLDPRSTETVLRHVAGLPEPLARSLCLGMLWDMVRDGELATRGYLPVVAAALPVEADLTVLTSTLTRAEHALRRYADPTWSAAGWARLAGVARQALRDSEPGSGTQTIWAAAFARAACDRIDLAALAGWLRGDDPPPGLPLRAELRWQVLHQLVAAGRADPDQIEAELAADPTTGGAQGAATARALLPTAEDKAAAWRLITDQSVPFNVRRAALDGFWHPTQTELTQAFVDPYFELLDKAWATWEAASARVFATQAYPGDVVGERTLAAADGWLAADRPPSLRRLVSDQRDGTARAIAARGADRAAG
jgi:aminopeptidase N